MPPAEPADGLLGQPRLHLRRVDSTSERAKALALAGAPHGTLVTAEEQTAGRGRQGRRWFAPPHSALLMSLVLRWCSEKQMPTLLPLAAAVAVGDVVGEQVLLKWPNDVVVRGGQPRAEGAPACGQERAGEAGPGRPAGGDTLAKLAGILIEGRPQDDWVVLGIGINVALELMQLPDDVRPLAASLGWDAEAIEPLLADLLLALQRRFDSTPQEILSAWRRRDALLGREVSWDRGLGVAQGVDDQGRLLVRQAGGQIMALAAGEVHLV